ncbi:MAG TPA: Smr/MutS family protein [Bryocella sp.]|nr:Smr/MutS family protein [Bryocella sp.]
MSLAIKTVILKQGMPGVEQARARLRAEIQAAQQGGIRVLKLVHGYGSSGVGGDLRIALQSTLRQMAAAREIQECIYGENWRTSDERAWKLLKQMPELKSDSDLGRGNQGITIAVL